MDITIHIKRAGGSFFFTVVPEERGDIVCTEAVRPCLHVALRDCRRRWPLRIDAWVLFGNHLHII